MSISDTVTKSIKLLCTTWKIYIVNVIVNLLPGDVLSSYLRVYIAKCFGLRVGSKTRFEKNIYFGDCRKIVIGRDCYVNREVYFDSYDHIRIGSNVIIGFRTILVTSTHNGPEYRRGKNRYGKPITIEDGVWIAASVIIGPGVTIGKGSVIAAGAVVMRSMPANCLIGGIPAKVIKPLYDEEVEKRETMMIGFDQ